MIEGTSGADIPDGKGGDDILQGGRGDDTYIFGRGYGQDKVIDIYGGYGSSAGTVQFLAGIAANDLSYSMDNNDLLITVRRTADSLRIKDGAGIRFRNSRSPMVLS